MIREIRIIVVVVVVIVVSTASIFEKVFCWREKKKQVNGFFANILVLERFVNNLIIFIIIIFCLFQSYLSDLSTPLV